MNMITGISKKYVWFKCWKLIQQMQLSWRFSVVMILKISPQGELLCEIQSTWNHIQYALKTPHVAELLTVDSSAAPWVKSSMMSNRHLIEIWIEKFFDLVTLTIDLCPWPRYPLTWPTCQNSRHTHTDTQTMLKLLHLTRHRCGM